MAADDMTELGTTGLRRVGGFIIDDQLSALRGTNAVNAWREMSDNDPIVGALLFAIEKWLLKVEWRTDPFTDETGTSTDEDIAVADFVESCRLDLNESWAALIQGILTMLPFGWSFHELVYKRRLGPDQTDPSKRSKHNDGRIGWRKIAYRAQETRWQWIFDNDPTTVMTQTTGNIRGEAVQPVPGRGVLASTITMIVLVVDRHHRRLLRDLLPLAVAPRGSPLDVANRHAVCQP